VLALSVSRTGDRRPKDCGGANHHYKTCKEIMSKETSKQIFLYSTSKWWLLKWLVKVWNGEEGKWKVVSPFSFSNLFYLFLILSNVNVSKNKYVVEKRKENDGFVGERKIQMKMVEEGWKRKWDNYRFTSPWELHVYSPARMSPYLWRLIHRCDWRSCSNRRGFF
jgi:hypothetical protein